MTFTSNEQARKSVEQFQRFDVDTQLALLWYGYLDIKDNLNPTNQPSVEVTGTALFNQIQALPQKEQLQAQRDILSSANTDITRAYGALSSSGKLEVWLRLAQGIEQGTIIPVPSNYELPSETQDFVNTVQKWDFEQRIDFLRSAVFDIGTQSSNN